MRKSWKAGQKGGLSIGQVVGQWSTYVHREQQGHGYDVGEPQDGNHAHLLQARHINTCGQYYASTILWGLLSYCIKLEFDNVGRLRWHKRDMWEQIYLCAKRKDIYLCKTNKIYISAKQISRKSATNNW